MYQTKKSYVHREKLSLRQQPAYICLNERNRLFRYCDYLGCVVIARSS